MQIEEYNEKKQEIKNTLSYQDKYNKLFKKVLELFTEWHDKAETVNKY